MHQSHVCHRRNDMSRLVREIKCRLHARSRTVYPLLSPLAFSFTPFSSFTRCAFPHQRLNRAVPVHQPRAGRIFYTIGGYYRISSCPSLLFLVITLASGFARIVARDVSADMCPGKIAEATACLPPVITCRLVGRDKNPPIAINHGELEKTARGNAAPRAYMLIFSVFLLLSQIPRIFRTRA